MRKQANIYPLESLVSFRCLIIPGRGYVWFLLPLTHNMFGSLPKENFLKETAQLSFLLDHSESFFCCGRTNLLDIYLTLPRLYPRLP